MYITVFCIAIFITTSACTDSLLLGDTKFDGNQIWSASVSDVGACAKACVRLKPCASFNYDISSKVCDLNTDTADLFPENVNYGVGMLYSAIAGWPESLDPDCHGRPCADDEVCIPGVVAQHIETYCRVHSCSYTCMKFSPTRDTTVTMVTPLSTGQTVTPFYTGPIVTSLSTGPTVDPGASVTYECPTSWILFDATCYLYVNSLRSWSSALAYCGTRGGYLAEVYNSWTNDFLINLMNYYVSQDNFGPWIGANDRAAEDEWIWEESGNQLTYTNWNTSQPNGGASENCVLYWQDDTSIPPKWFDHKCSATLQSVCQQAATPVRYAWRGATESNLNLQYSLELAKVCAQWRMSLSPPVAC